MSVPLGLNNRILVEPIVQGAKMGHMPLSLASMLVVIVKLESSKFFPDSHFVITVHMASSRMKLAQRRVLIVRLANTLALPQHCSSVLTAIRVDIKLGLVLQSVVIVLLD